ncbi:DUF4382 domain-containing protein [Halorientalis halophila]|uniref:DUF4382 domain-containing protein n=1 Tax=Halorientalis halophila TaxID=3108499 RepID=UPI00300BC81A
MDRRRFLEATGITAVGISLAGCSGGSGGNDAGTGTLATLVTDQPGDITDFETLVLRVSALRTVRAGAEATDDGEAETATADAGSATEAAEADDDGGETTHELDEPVEFDLRELVDGETDLLGETELETGTYAYLKLVVDEVVEATLTDGESAEVTTPGNAPLKFNAEFDIRADETTTFVADFTPIKQGRTGRYQLKPVADGVQVRYEDEETTTA